MQGLEKDSGTGLRRLWVRIWIRFGQGFRHRSGKSSIVQTRFWEEFGKGFGLEFRQGFGQQLSKGLSRV